MYGKVGPNTLAVGGTGPIRIAGDGSVVISPGLTDAALAGRLFYAANQAAVATTTTLNTTFTGLALSNPSTSGKIFILREFSWGLSVVASAAGLLSLASCTIAAPAQAAGVTPRCTRIGYATSAAITDDGATTVGPALVKPITTYGTGAVTTWQGATQQVAKLDGQIIIVPGQTIVTDTTTATTAAFLFGFLWEEIPM